MSERDSTRSVYDELGGEISALLHRAETAENEREGWHRVVIDCERAIGAVGTADSPLSANLQNLVRDAKAAIKRQEEKIKELEADNKTLESIISGLRVCLHAASDDRSDLNMAANAAYAAIKERDDWKAKAEFYREAHHNRSSLCVTVGTSWPTTP